MTDDSVPDSEERSDAAAGVDPEAAIRLKFIDHDLGEHSSHPSTAPRRMAFWRWLSLGIGTMAMGYSVFAVWQAFQAATNPLGGVLSGFRQAGNSANLILFAIAVGLSATLTAALTVRISKIGRDTAHRSVAPVVYVSIALLLASALFGLCIAFGWLVTTNSLAVVAKNRWWMAVAAALPLEVLLLYCEWKERQADGSRIGWLWTALRQLLFAASVTATAIVMTPAAGNWISGQIFGWLQSPTGWLGTLLIWIPGSDALIRVAAVTMKKSIGGFISTSLGLGFTLMTVAWVTAKVSRIASITSTSTRLEPPRPSLWSRLLGVLAWLNPFKWFGNRSKGADDAEGLDDGVTTGGFAPAWMRGLQEVLKDAIQGRARVKFFPRVAPDSASESEHFSPESGEGQIEILFNSRAPTVDQVEALRGFDELWEAHARSLQRNGFGPAPESHCDLMVQAFPESFDDPEDSGVLELQVAASVLAVVARGQRVLFLVSDTSERERIVAAVQSRYESLRIETLYRVDGMASGDLARWAPPAAAPGSVMDERPPDVLVATLTDYEQAFFGGANAAHIMRALLFDAEVVMVPNLVALAKCPEGRLHFPFILDKHRLLLASENRTMQLLVGTPPIGERPVQGRSGSDGLDPEVHVALEAIALRIFGGDAKLQGHSFVLRKRRRSFPARVVVHVSAASISIAIDTVALQVARSEGHQRVCVILGREDARPDEARRSALSVGKKKAITVVHELDFADIRELSERIAGIPFVVVQGRSGGRLVRAIASRVDHAEVTLVEVTSVQQVEPNPTPTWALQLPVFPSAESPALALAHLRSGAFQLSSDTLIRRDELVRFGIAWDRARWSAGDGFHALHEGWAIELDGRISANLSALEDQGEIWPAAILRRRVRKERPVLLGAPAERGLALTGEEMLSLAQDGVLPDPNRAATWVTQRGQVLGTIDLAYSASFVRLGERQSYRPLFAERSADQGWIIVGQPYHDDPDEPVLSALEISLAIPASARGRNLQLRQGENLRLFIIRDVGGQERCWSHERIVGLASQRQRRAGGTVGSSAVSPFGPLEFQLRVGLSVLCMGTSEWIGELESPTSDGCDVDAVLPDWISGEWKIGVEQVPGRTFSPAFTRAVQQCLSQLAPGILDFARVAAFWTGSSNRGIAILFIEPFTTVGTAAEAMRTLLDDRAFRQRFVGRLLEAVLSEEAEELPKAPLFRVKDDPEAEKRDRELAQELITAIPGTVIDISGTIGVIMPDGEATLAERPTFDPQPIDAVSGVYVWKWRTESAEIGLSVEIGIEQATADKATASYGCSPTENDAARLRACGVRLLEGNRLSPSYGWMVSRSESDLEPLAQRLLLAAQQAGASTLRDRVEFFASFVQSFRYSLQAEGRMNDGKIRLGVQMPVETLYTKQGDCDSLSVLLVALVRTAKLASGCVVLIDEADGGHAMAAFELEPRSKKDFAVRVKIGAPKGARMWTFTIVETTSAGSRMGQSDPDYYGRYVRLDAIG